MVSAEYSSDLVGGNSDSQTPLPADRGESLQPGEVKQAGARLPCTGMRVPGARRTGEAGIAIPVTPPAVHSEA